MADTVGDVTVAILAGGKGTRLASVVSDRPKALAEINGRPFLAYQLDLLADCGARRVVLCTGYMAELVERSFGSRYRTLELSYSREAAPLGTAGALRQALALCEAPTVLALNGDSYCHADLPAFYRAHFQRRAAASALLVHMDDTSRYGRVLIDGDGRLTAFEEKRPEAGAGWINAGVYLIARTLLETIPSGRAVSIEREVFPSWLGSDFYGFTCRTEFIDIGTPQSYAQAAEFFGRKKSA